jgi:hypothetical protein
MKLTSRIWIGLKALHQLGLAQVGLYGLYQLGLRSGHYRRQLTAALSRLNTIDYKNIKLRPCLPGLPEPDTMLKILGNQVGKLYEQADEIVEGKIRLFGGPAVPLALSLPGPLGEWTRYESMDGIVNGQDIKYIWEPGRFGWACTLAMAYHLSKKEAYAIAFWQYTGQFLASNPPFMGPHWCSAQEVAIRLVALAFALQVFAQPGLLSGEQLEKITRSIAMHAERIIPTLVYARSQNNNHLILEALGLYTVSALLPLPPLATRWHNLGWHWLQHAFLTQIDQAGSYVQHSTNYHRLMLQAALWMVAVHNFAFPGEHIPPKISTRLANATTWMWQMLDPESGRVPNLGHNDGAYILPLTVCPFADYRPVVSTSARVFLNTALVPGGEWEDMGGWLGFNSQPNQAIAEKANWKERFNAHPLPAKPPHTLANAANDSWAYFRVTNFRTRPAHADQLHVDLWWRGLNLTLDPGTYLYNSPAPWENSLMSAFVHNTLTVDGQDFMRRAGRFLYLDWDQAKVVTVLKAPDGSYGLKAQHDGYRELGITHSRTLSFLEGRWQIFDYMKGPSGQIHKIRLNWLLPDWEYKIKNISTEGLPAYEINLKSPLGVINLLVGTTDQEQNSTEIKGAELMLARAGELLVGSEPISPIWGWYSPTYGVKIPALACILEATSTLPLTLVSAWNLPNET